MISQQNIGEKTELSKISTTLSTKEFWIVVQNVETLFAKK